jgi:hypothetical protein
MWRVEAIVEQRIGSALREGEQARSAKAIRSAKKERTLKLGGVKMASYTRGVTPTGTGATETGRATGCLS